MKALMLTIIGILCLNIIQANDAEKRIYYTAKTDQAPQIDGVLDNIIWDKVEWSGDFIQHEPEEGKAPSQNTAFKILYDDNNLYLFIKAYDSEPEKISRLMARRDRFTGDFVEINIDSDYDKQTAFSFYAMASGVKGDKLITRNGNSWDSSWDAIWYLKTSMDDEGWNAEIRIPFNQLRFGKKDEHIWGIQIMRHLFREEERSRWQFISKDAPGFVHLFGELRGIKNINPKRQFDIVPYTLAKLKNFKKEEGNPYADGSTFKIEGGIDGKIGITNDLTLDFTINPDFGQVEADPSKVNLTAFESYFSEKRPFFIEGKSIFNYPPSWVIVINNLDVDNLFYSRRIGRRPHYYPDLRDNEYVDQPDATTILSAFKLSGKTKNGLSIGIMESITSEENAKLSYLGDERKVTVEPLTNYFVARVKKDFNKGETTLGGMITAVNRDLPQNDSVFLLPRAAYTGGIDFLHYWKERTFYVGLVGNFSYLKGNADAISELQYSSARYFQRPDASHLSVDESETKLSGTAASFKFGHKSKGRLSFQTSVSYRSPEFEINDIGYMRRSDVVHHGTWVGYYIRDPFWILENFYLNNNIWMYFNFDGKLLSLGKNVNFNGKLKNKWHFNGSLTHVGRDINISALRGGEALLEPSCVAYSFNISSDRRKKFYFNFGSWNKIYRHDYSKQNELWMGMTYRPVNALSFSATAFYNNLKRELYYVSEEEFNGDPRYVFGKINQKTLGLTFRINYNIGPDLSIQYYGQPFVSSADYNDFKLITDPDSDEFNNRYELIGNEALSYNNSGEFYTVDEDLNGEGDYTFNQPDYNFVQFRSNLVLRWEYLPGSTLFLVWSQGRSRSNTSGAFDYGRSISDLFNVYPTDVFLVKFSYRFSL